MAVDVVKVQVRSVTHEVANRAIELLVAAGVHGHRSAIDAALVAIALDERADVTIYTSDEDDMRRLSDDRVSVVKV